MITPVRLSERKPGGGGLTEGRGGFLVLLDFLNHVGCEPWCSRVPCRFPVATIFRWAATCTGLIGGPSRKCVGLHTLHARLVRTALGYCEGYRSGGCGGPYVLGGPL